MFLYLQRNSEMLCALCIFPWCQDLYLQTMKRCITRDSVAIRRTCMCLWRSRLAEHCFACPQQCVSACVVCIWQTYCTSVKMQAATWSTVNSMYPSSHVHHSSSLTIAQGPTSINTHSFIHVVLVANIVQWWIVEVLNCSDVQLQWPLSRHLKTEELLNSGQWWNFCICACGSSNSHLHTVNGPRSIYCMWVRLQLCCLYQTHSPCCKPS